LCLADCTGRGRDSRTGRVATIKWPNDVRVGGRKIAGILVERALSSKSRVTASSPDPGLGSSGAIIGIGLNVNLAEDAFPPELGGMATSIQIELDGAVVDRSALANDLIRRLDTWYDQSRAQGVGSLNDCWRARSEHIGQIVEVETPSGRLVGRLVDIDMDLGLTLDLGAGPRREREHSGQVDSTITRLRLADVLALHP
jgi:BirA family transcriptional regulator, biotin operon repressor / biotin---[acetyl-CoA-carboxylase] ligase